MSLIGMDVRASRRIELEGKRSVAQVGSNQDDMVCRYYGWNPLFICCSATIGNPGELADV